MEFLAAAPATWTLIVLNCAISFYALYADRSFLDQSVFSIRQVREHNQWYRLLTAGFLHGSPLHLLFNMYVLFMFGTGVEYRFGTTDFLIIYFGSQLTAKAMSLLMKWNQPDYQSLGASGAVSGILLAYCAFAPMQLLYFLGIVPIPAIVVAALYILYSMLVMNKQSNIAHEAHLGGAIGGLIITFILHPGLIGLS